jgi:hypothetical protein
MRTTLNIDPDLLDIAKNMVRAAHTSAGEVISDLMRRALESGLQAGRDTSAQSPIGTTASPVNFGFAPIVPPGGQRVTNDMVRTLRNEFGD